jgi:electron transfer flavoprotein beta subunit
LYSLTVDAAITAIREIDGGKETVSTSLPQLVEKGLVEERFAYPKYEGIMTARSKALTIVEPRRPVNTKAVKFEKPAPRSAVHLISSDNLDELIDLLHNEAKVI